MRAGSKTLVAPFLPFSCVFLSPSPLLLCVFPPALQRQARPTEKTNVVWRFERGREHLRVETRRDGQSGEFVLTLHQADGTQLVDRFRNRNKFQKRLYSLERELLAARWTSRRSIRRDDDERVHAQRVASRSRSARLRSTPQR